jgi:ketosteroid isomerase-like protein
LPANHANQTNSGKSILNTSGAPFASIRVISGQFYFCSLVAALCGSTSLFAEPPNANVGSEIRAVLKMQQDAWNRGDIDTFMNGYSRSEDTVFVSGDEVTRGWQKVLDRYKKKYSDRAKMGTLTFSDLEITPLSNDSAVVLGSWELKRASDHPHGRFTLIFRRFPEGWKIVHDHTSAASPP